MEDRAEHQTIDSAPAKLSYKFQRLREQIRQAILQHELNGQLPGERELGKRFHANAKTINKALCDLAGDGLVKRFIGRGTFVTYAEAGAAALPQRRVVHWLCAGGDGVPPVEYRAMLESALAERGDRLEAGPVRIAPDGRLDVPPGFFRADRHVDALVIATPSPLSRPTDDRPSDALLLALARRQIPTVLLGSVCDAMKRHAVLPDYVAAGFRLSEHLFDLGCREVDPVIVSDEGAEIRAVLHGWETSCRRRRTAGSVLNLSAAHPSANGRAGNEVGYLCVGRAAFDRFRATQRDPSRVARMAVAVEPGDDIGRRDAVATYEFDPRRLVEWAVRLIAECGRGTPPIEVLVPGSLHIRASHPTAVRRDLIAEAVV